MAMNQFNEPLAALREKVLTGKDFKAIMTYFFDHCADHPGFIEIGKRIEDPKLEQLLPAVLGAARKQPTRLSNLLLIAVPHAKFIHGGFMVDGRPGTLIYFEDIDRGVAALLQRDGKTTDFVRFSCQTLGTSNIWQ